MKIKIISDTHFGHKFLAKKFYEMEIGVTNITEDMDESIIKQWNESISEDDIVLHLGDVSFHGKNKTEAIFKRLNGHKILVPGNHDIKNIKNNRHYYNLVGFDGVEVDTEKIVLNSLKLILSHKPVGVLPEGYTNVHGHIHPGYSHIIFALDKQKKNICWDHSKKEGNIYNLSDLTK